MTELTRYYRLPKSWVAIDGGDTPQCRPGFFKFGQSLTLFGRCDSATPAPGARCADALSSTRIDKNHVRLPFDLDEVCRNLRCEEYMQSKAKMSGFLREAYYRVRPLLGVGIRKYLQRAYLSGWRHIEFPRWPLDRSVDRLMEKVLALALKASGGGSVPFIWFWPGEYQSCAIITHDVETEAGRDFCSKLMDLDDSCGMKAAFQVVPEERYAVPPEFIASIRERGFEVNVHDLNHDGRLFADERTFMKRVPAINRYGKQFGARGFRAGVMYRNQRWFHALDFEYEMSIPAVAHLDPQRGGCCTSMPFFIGNMLELPLTTTQDYALFYLINERTLDIWKQEIEALQSSHSLISILVHPDYILEPWSQDLYLQLLRYIQKRAVAEHIWLTTPSQLNDWWRCRDSLTLSQLNGEWQIVGDGSQRARIAYAYLEDQSVRYSFEPPRSHAAQNHTAPTSRVS